MKRWGTVLLLCFFLFSGGLTVSADTAEETYREQVAVSGADDLFDTLPEQTRDLLRSLGITDFNVKRYTALQPSELMNTLVRLFAGQMGGALSLCGVLLGAVLLAGFAESLRCTADTGKTSDMMGRLGAVAVNALVLLPIGECIKQVAATTESVRVLMFSYIPTYAAVILAGGHPSLAASYSSVLLAGAECVAALVTGAALPLLVISLALGTAGSLSERNRLASFSTAAAKCAMWLLGTSTALFTALLSMQSFVAAAADSIGQRAAKMTIGSFVPIVGGALSEAFGTVTGCLQMLRSTLGMFGVLATAALVLPTFFRCLSWSIALWLCRLAADTMGVSEAGRVLGVVGTVVKVLMGILAACALFLVVTTTLVTVAGR